jgi:hypothetical protein
LTGFHSLQEMAAVSTAYQPPKPSSAPPLNNPTTTRNVSREPRGPVINVDESDDDPAEVLSSQPPPSRPVVFSMYPKSVATLPNPVPNLPTIVLTTHLHDADNLDLSNRPHSTIDLLLLLLQGRYLLYQLLTLNSLNNQQQLNLVRWLGLPPLILPLPPTLRLQYNNE